MCAQTNRPRPGEVYRVTLRKDEKPQPEGPAVPTGEGLNVLPRHWFCVAVTQSGEIIKKEANSILGLREICESAQLAWVDYWVDNFEKQVLPAATQMGFSSTLVSGLIGEHFAPYQDLDTEMGVQLPSIYVQGFEVKSNPFVVLIKKNFILTIHPFSPDRRFARLRRYSESILKKIPMNALPADKITSLFLRLIDENNDRNFGELRKIEESGDKLSEALSDPKTPRQKLGLEIHLMKHALIAYLNELWATVHVIHALRYGDADLITDDPALLNRMAMLADEVSRQIGLGEHLSEVLASGLEVLQTIYNNQLQTLNNRLALLMNYLTIIGTAVLVPNTIATMFGNGVFQITPKDLWWWAPLMVVVTVGSGWAAYWWIKKLGWLKKVD